MTPRGADSVRSREYRMQSPVFTHTADGRILEPIGAGFTNRPNLELRALNRATEREEKLAPVDPGAVGSLDADEHPVPKSAHVFSCSGSSARGGRERKAAIVATEQVLEPTGPGRADDRRT